MRKKLNELEADNNELKSWLDRLLIKHQVVAEIYTELKTKENDDPTQV